MTTPEPISPELQAKIDALPDENLKANLLRRLNRPWTRTKSKEQIFEEMLANHEEFMKERAKWRQWRDEEVLEFARYFEQKAPSDYADFLNQQRDKNEIDDDLWWRVGRLADQWIPGLAYSDNGNLLGKLRDHFRSLLK
jgi:hypothetical protein